MKPNNSMTNNDYNWKRYWYPRATYFYLDHKGYLFDPDTEIGKRINPDLMTYFSLSDIPCLVLLGEPGIGKSHAITSAFTRAFESADEQSDAALHFDLRSYPSDTRLHSSIFEHQVFEDWHNGSTRLCLFLDSLDECLLTIKAMTPYLVEELNKYPTERLSLRIACRTADWPNTLEDGLREIWGKDNVGVFELAPLCKNDVMNAAEAEDIEPKIFLEAVESAEVVPFAIKPITLKFLLNKYKRHLNLPSSRSQLFLDGCKLLCEESNVSRLESRSTGDLSADQRLITAARIAAVTTISNSYAVWTSIDLGNIPEEDILFNEIAGNIEDVNGQTFNITGEAIREVLGTGLFSSRGLNRMGWAHQTYAEFLTAWYLAKKTVPSPQIMNLITHPGDDQCRVVPQLKETAAWIAIWMPEIFQRILEVEPDLLLLSDVATFSDDDRSKIVASFLDLLEAEELIDYTYTHRSRYSVLSHTGLCEQLRPYILAELKSDIVRMAAIEIGEACDISKLQEDLISIALNPEDKINVRISAAGFISRLGNENTKTLLKPLAFGQAGEDPDDELKGRALRALWPSHISIDELLQCLSFQKNDSLLGSYTDFIDSQLGKHLKEEDIPAALCWVEEHVKLGWGSSLHWESLFNQIMLLGWEYIEAEDVLIPFSRAAFARLKDTMSISRGISDKVFSDKLNHDSTNRRRLACAIIDLLESSENDAYLLVYSPTPVIKCEDLPWLITQLNSEENEDRRVIWAELISRVVDRQNQHQLELVYEARKEHQELKSATTKIFDPIQLNSKIAKELKERHHRSQEVLRLQSQERITEEEFQDRLISQIIKCDEGNVDEWWKLSLTLVADPSEEYRINYYIIDLSSTYGWKNVNDDVKTRILNAARNYILERGPETDEWLCTNKIYHPAYAGYRALHLLYTEDYDFFNQLSREIWERWAPIILAIRVIDKDMEIYQKVLLNAYTHASKTILDNLLMLIQYENDHRDYLPILGKLERIFDDEMRDILLPLLSTKDLGLTPFENLLGFLLGQGVDEAKSFTEYSLSKLSLCTDRNLRYALILARCLFLHTKDAGWKTIWETIQRSQEFGRKFLLETAYGAQYDSEAFSGKLSENQMADLYIWLVKQFPPEHDPEESVDPEQSKYLSKMTTRRSVGFWRDSIPRQIARKGTLEACEEIQRIITKLPKSDLKWVYAEAQTNARRETWNPPKPIDVLTITNQSDKRYIQNGNQLLEVLIESLDRLQIRLQGETPSSREIWDRSRKRKYIPNDEKDFSDYIKRHLDSDLQQRGIIANREVEIRRGHGNQGEETDIYIDAISLDTADTTAKIISAIIEVKGCWNRHVCESMETQLVNRYLQDNECIYGLYLVGWFLCDAWDNKDYKKKQVPFNDIDNAISYFHDQATSLSDGILTIKSYVLDATL